MRWIHGSPSTITATQIIYNIGRADDMDINAEPKRFIVRSSDLPELFPTNRHSEKFWEALGRIVGTFGFLEEVLGKAIFAFTGTQEYDESQVEKAYKLWLPTLKRALSDSLGGLIDSYEKAVRDNPDATVTNIDELVSDLREASTVRNVLCHGSWRSPSREGKSIPLFVNRKGDIFPTAFDISSLMLLQKSVVDLTCAVINTVTHMGWQFPGSNGPGNVIWNGTK